MQATSWITDYVWLDTLIIMAILIGPALIGMRGVFITIPLLLMWLLFVAGVPLLAIVGIIAAFVS